MHPDGVDAADRVPHGGASGDVLDFSANVNPETPAGVEAVYRDALDASTGYPDDAYAEFRAAAANYVDCERAAVVPTAGGLEAIRLAIQTTVAPGESVLVPYPSFGEYAREVKLQGATPLFVPYDELLDADPADQSLAIICNPNNPTGDTYDASELRAFVEQCQDAETIVLVDEAFLGFTDEPTLAGMDGVVVARSLTKLFGLPGLRAGFAVATGDRRDALETARRAWNLGTPAARVGAHCLQDIEFVAETRRRVRSERERMAAVLSDRFDVSPSDAPFLLLDVGDRTVDDVVETAAAAGIAVRDATTFRGLDSHVRVAVRTPAENDQLLEVFEDV